MGVARATIAPTPCRGLRRPCTPRKRGTLHPNVENEKGASQEKRAAAPQDCQEGASLISASSANLTKDAHRGRHGTSCPAMPPLRLPRTRRDKETEGTKGKLPYLEYVGN